MKLLLIEDDETLCRNMKDHLSQEGYLVDACETGDDGLFYALQPDGGYDLAIIDRMLPVIDGLTILKAMREKGNQIPVILITGMSGLQDKINGLDNGADDYLVKPFHLSELSARIRAMARRPATYTEQKQLHYQDLTLDLARKELCCGEERIALTPKEYNLMCAFLEAPDALHSRNHLMARGWESNHAVEPGNVDNYIYFLRKRLRALGSSCQITAVYGAGYLLEAAHDS